MERISVVVRVRPLDQQEASKGSAWRIAGNTISLSTQPRWFDFDRVFGEESKNLDIYEAHTKDIVAAAIRGFNGTVFAYGQTSSGKTHTMRGSPAEPGVIPLAVQDVFRNIKEAEDREFLLRMSYMEIYNEEINDLLAPEHQKLQVHESLERGIFVAGLREEIVASPEQVLQLMEFGESHRHIGETNMNVYSSRSHTIFRMVIESRDKNEDDSVGTLCDAVRVSVLNLVDLAGSERAAKTGAEGTRLKEGSHINKSLMTLGNVINKLSEGVESQGGHVPYRDSKLTRILQPALGGNAKTAIICNITPALIHVDETKGTLQFASRALRVTNCAQVNEVLTDAALLKRQKREIEELRAKLQGSHSEHLAEDILNLRNTLLQSELERERIALELQEEKKAQAERERQLKEQAQKIENLSTIVLYSAMDDREKRVKKNNRRETWCPNVPLNEFSQEESIWPSKGTLGEIVSGRRDRDLPPPFQKLCEEQESSSHTSFKDSGGASVRGFLKENVDVSSSWTECALPDASASVNVTDRKKKSPVESMTLNEVRDELLELQTRYQDLECKCENQRKMKNSEIEDLKNRLAKAEAAANKQQKVNKLHLGQSTNRRGKSLTGWESETILMNKQLEDEVKTLELQKLYMQRDLDRHLELAKEEKENANRTLEELQHELGEAQGEAVKNKEQLDSALAEIKLLKTEKEEGLDTISSEFDELRIEVESLRDTNIEVQSVISDSIQAISLAYMFLQEFSGNVVDIKVELHRMEIMGRLSECTQDLKEGNGRKSAIVEILSHRVIEDIANVKELETSTASDQLPSGSWAEEKRQLEDVHTQTLIKLQAAEKEIKSHRYDLDAVCKSLELCKSEKKEAEEKIRQLEFFLCQKVEELNESASVHGSTCDYFLKMTDELDKKIEEQNASLNKHKSTCEALLERTDELEKDVQASLAQKIEEHKMLIGNHENDCTALRKKIEDLGKEKAVMADQISDGHKKQEELKIAIEHAKNMQEEQGKTYIAEKTQLMAEVSSLRKEVAKSASSAVTKEREILRKELEKTKLRLKDTEAKLRSILQDKSKLEAEKANIDREIKLLRAQSSLLQRDISKRESLADKRRESRALDLSRTKNQHDFFEQSLQLKTMELERANFDLEILQEKYKNVERTLFEVQEKLAASEGELFVASEERETLTSELELLSEKLKVTSSELESLHEKHALLNQQLHERGNICSDLEESLSATLKENEEIALQLADVFLQLEEEKAICSSQEKVTMEALEEKRKLSMVNAELKMELESSNDQCKHLSEQLSLVAEKSQEERRVSSLELDQLREELHHSVAEHEISENTMRSISEDLKSRVEVHSLENEKLSGEIVALRNELERVTREGDEICKQFAELSLKLEEVGAEKLAAFSEQAILKDRYSEIQCKLISATDLVEALSERMVILERELDNEKIHFIKETSKLRFALRITRAKLDAFRGRYEEVLNELEEMHRKFMEDSRKLKEQLVAARLESFELKKKLMAVE